MQMYCLDHIALWVTDLDRSADFYTNIIGLEPILSLSRFPEKGGVFRDLRLHIGGEHGTGVHLFQSPFAAYCVNHAPVVTASTDKSAICVDHYAFRVDLDLFHLVKKNLESNGHRVRYLKFDSPEPGFHPSQSIQFSDPDGHVVEFQCYEH